MKDIFLKEIKEQNSVIRNCKDEKEISEGNKNLFATIDKILHLSKTARHDGLLALEEEAMRLEGFPGGNYLKNMLMLIVEGTDGYLLDEICGYKYFAEGLEGYQALAYIMMLEGCLAIQAGENPFIIKARLLAMLSEKQSSAYEKNKKEEEAASQVLKLQKGAKASSDTKEKAKSGSNQGFLSAEEIRELLSTVKK